MTEVRPRRLDALPFKEYRALCEQLINAGLVEASNDDGDLYVTPLGEDYISAEVEDFEMDSQER